MNATNTGSERHYQGGLLSTILSPQQTANQLAIIEFNLPKGAEPPTHIHKNEDEVFYVLEGILSVLIADNEKVLKAGTAIFAPRNTPHSFKILSESARFLNLISPGTLWNYFMEFSTAAGSEMPAINPDQPGNRQRMLEVITQQFGVEFLMPEVTADPN